MPFTSLSESTLLIKKIYEEPNPSIQGWMLPEELQWLFEQACKFKTILEVGSWKGRSTHALLSSGNAVISVDTFKGSKSELNQAHQEATKHDIFPEFILNVGHFPNLSVLRMDSVEASKLFYDFSFEMIFIDSDHEYFAFEKDLLAWLSKCKYLLCGHDLEEAGVRQVLEDHIPNYEKGPGSLWRLAWNIP